jgi:hypothetical protein
VSPRLESVRTRRVVAAWLAATAVLLLVPTAAFAQTGPTATTSPTALPSRIELVSQDPWTPVGTDVRLRLNVSNPQPGATLSITVYPPLIRRQDFDAVADGSTSTRTVGQHTMQVDGLPVDGSGARVVTLPVQTTPPEPDRFNIGYAGVYPLRVEVRDARGIDPLSNSFVTALVVGQPQGRPLDFVWVWPMVAAPSYLPGGRPDPTVLASLRPEGRLGKQALALRSVPDVPVTLAPGPETLEAWLAYGNEDASVLAGAQTVRAASSTHQTLGGPFVPVDFPSLIDHGLSTAVDEELMRGNEVLQTSIGSVVDSRTRLVRPASTGALGRLRAGGTDRAIIDGDSLAVADNRTPTSPTPAGTVTVRAPVSPTESETIEVLATDPGLQKLLGSDLPAPLRAQLMLAGLAVIANETPAIPRAITLVNPDDFDASANFYTTLLNGLRGNPYIRPVSAAQAFDTLEPRETVERQLVAGTSADPMVSANAYRDQRARLTSFGSYLARPDDPGVGQADRALLASVTSAWPLDAGRARAPAHLRTVDKVVNRFLQQIEVPDPKSITLTSRSGAIPLTFRNETGGNVRLRAALSSDKVFFPKGSVLELELPPKSSTWQVAVETRTSGTFPVSLEVTSIDGVLPISQRRLEVRSTFVSTVGFVLMGSAVLFLAVWWGYDLRRRRRRRAHTAVS